MEWVKPIDQLEAEVRYRGVFMLVDLNTKKLKFYGFKRQQPDFNKVVDLVRGRTHEMVNYLIASAKRAKGETT